MGVGMTNFISIDPGASGGIAGIDSEGIVGCQSMPDTEGDIVALLTGFAAKGVRLAVIEDVGGYCGSGQPGSAMWKFGFNCGFLRGSCMALGFRVELVKPQKWQKHFGLGTVKSNGGKTAWKNRLKGEAQRRFPNVDVTLKTADSLLILDYARNL